jgi:hypothetical protein
MVTNSYVQMVTKLLANGYKIMFCNINVLATMEPLLYLHSDALEIFQHPTYGFLEKGTCCFWVWLSDDFNLCMLACRLISIRSVGKSTHIIML